MKKVVFEGKIALKICGQLKFFTKEQLVDFVKEHYANSKCLRPFEVVEEVKDEKDYFIIIDGKILLKVFNSNVLFSTEQLAQFVKEHFNREKGLQFFELAEKPTEGRAFEVVPSEIFQKKRIFLKRREDSQEEEARKNIFKSLKEVKKNPEKYVKFYVLIPRKQWIYEQKTYKSAKDLETFAKKLGFLLDPVQANLILAQRIINGESWAEIAKNPDTLSYFRLVKGKNGNFQIRGGSQKLHTAFPPSHVDDQDYGPNYKFDNTVPSIGLNNLEKPISSDFKE